MISGLTNRCRNTSSVEETSDPTGVDALTLAQVFADGVLLLVSPSRDELSKIMDST